MNELIVIGSEKIGEGTIQTVNARDLHDFLEAKKDFSNWIKDRIEKYGFIENQDFVVVEVLRSPESASSKARVQKAIDYHLSLDMAKELSMVERNDKGKQARQYFLECERKVLAQPYAIPTHAEALRLAADALDQNNRLTLQIEADRPMVELATAISRSTKNIEIGDYVKVISTQEGFVIGRNNFFKWLRFERILDNNNLPLQRYVDCGWFKVSEGIYENANSNGPRVTFTTMITGKGQISILDRFKKSPHSSKYLNKSASANRKDSHVYPCSNSSN